MRALRLKQDLCANGQAVVEFDGLVLAHNERTVAEITHVAIGDPKEIWQWCDRGYRHAFQTDTRFQVGRVTTTVI